MSKVYVVYEPYSEGIIGVYTSKERAEEIVEIANRSVGDSHSSIVCVEKELKK